jgi:hypothetical protein
VDNPANRQVHYHGNGQNYRNGHRGKHKRFGPFAILFTLAGLRAAF